MSELTIVCGEKKSEGGKLVKVCIKLLGNTVRGVLISGDFFVDPGEVFEELAQELANIEIERNEVTALVTERIKKKKLEFIGISMRDIEEAIYKALSSQSQ